MSDEKRKTHCPRCKSDSIEIECRGYENRSVSAVVWTVCRTEGCGYSNGPFKL